MAISSTSCSVLILEVFVSEAAWPSSVSMVGPNLDAIRPRRTDVSIRYIERVAKVRQVGERGGEEVAQGVLNARVSGVAWGGSLAP
jgi:hypothetical protein